MKWNQIYAVLTSSFCNFRCSSDHLSIYFRVRTVGREQRVDISLLPWPVAISHRLNEAGEGSWRGTDSQVLIRARQTGDEDHSGIRSPILHCSAMLAGGVEGEQSWNREPEFNKTQVIPSHRTNWWFHILFINSYSCLCHFEDVRAFEEPAVSFILGNRRSIRPSAQLTAT